MAANAHLVFAHDPETGLSGAREVLATWPHTDTLVEFEVCDSTVTTTEDHEFWNVSDQAWQETQHIDAGDLLLTADGATVEAGTLLWGTAHVAPAFDLTVDEIHTYHVTAGDESVLVHNQNQTCRGLEINGSRADLPDLAEQSYYDILIGEPDTTIIATGDVAVRRTLGIPEGPAPDFVTYNNAADTFSVREVKASFVGEADAATAVQQIRAAVEALEETVQGARIGRLELVIPEGGILAAPFAVSGNQLVRVTDAGTVVERIAGNVVLVVEAPLQQG